MNLVQKVYLIWLQSKYLERDSTPQQDLGLLFKKRTIPINPKSNPRADPKTITLTLTLNKR